MIKQATLYLCIPVLLLLACESDNNKYDTRAIENLDKLSETIGKLNSCSYTLNTTVSEDNSSEFTNEHDVYFSGRDNLYIHTVGTKGEKSYWFNGNSLAYFSYDKNQYATVEATGHTLEMMDSLHSKFGIDFPAADFFYPSFTDDIIKNYHEVLYFGEEEIDEVECVSIEASNEDETLQIWIDKATNLPYKIIIESAVDNSEYYEAVFSNWNIDPQLPDLLFEFEPPAGANRVKLQAKN